MKGLHLVVVALVATTTGCSAFRPRHLPREPARLVAVKTVKLPHYLPTVTHPAEHTFFDVKRGSEARWERVELINASSGVVRHPIPAREARADCRWDNSVAVLAVVAGERAERLTETLDAEARAWDEGYAAWPGPNSNTFAARVLRTSGELWVELDHNAVGTDHATFALRRTTAGLGIQLDTPVLGIQLGLLEGVELHLLQTTIGVSFWSPAIKLPALPRLGPPVSAPASLSRSPSPAGSPPAARSK